MNNEDEETNRHRSPNYPLVSLENAVELASKLYSKDRTAATLREVASRHLGYKGYNGTSAQILGSLAQYGLTEEAGTGKIRVSSLGEGLALPKSDAERTELLSVALTKPRIFGKLIAEYGLDGIPSDETLYANLRREYRFTEEAAHKFLRSFKNSVALVGLLSKDRVDKQAAENESVRNDEKVASERNEPSGKAYSITLSQRDRTSQSTDTVEQIQGKLSPRTRAELSVIGPLGPKELANFKNWIQAVVMPWIEYTQGAEMGEDEQTQ